MQQSFSIGVEEKLLEQVDIAFQQQWLDYAYEAESIKARYDNVENDSLGVSKLIGENTALMFRGVLDLVKLTEFPQRHLSVVPDLAIIEQLEEAQPA